METTSLTDLIIRMETRYPKVIHADGIGSRAQSAGDFVSAHMVKFLGYQGGSDYWQVNGQTVSLAAGTCTCSDTHAPRDDRGGKLCSHRIAAQFRKTLGQQNGIAAILASAPADLDRITLFVDVFYADSGRQYTLTGYRMAGTVEYSHGERVEFIEAEFNAALRAHGWSMTQAPSRQKGIRYYYLLSRGTEGAVGLNALTSQDAETIRQRGVMAQLHTVDQMQHEGAL